MVDFEQSDLAREVIEFHLLRFEELPQIALYMDQVLSVAEEGLYILSNGEKDKILTAAMVNNYVKQKVIAPPVSKKYSSEHVAYLIMLSVLKQVLSISELCRLLEIQQRVCSVQEAYNSFCQELEHAIQAVFVKKDFRMKDSTVEERPERGLLRVGVFSFVSKLYLQKYLSYLSRKTEEEQE